VVKELIPIVRQCQCEQCSHSQNNAQWRLHHQINVFLSRLDERQRRWYVALESQKLGHGGDTLLSQITGLDVETIRRGRRELETDLRDSPLERQRGVGGGRPPVEKKTRGSKKN
jgi:hypothetical protein